MCTAECQGLLAGEDLRSLSAGSPCMGFQPSCFVFLLGGSGPVFCCAFVETCKSVFEGCVCCQAFQAESGCGGCRLALFPKSFPSPSPALVMTQVHKHPRHLIQVDKIVLVEISWKQHAWKDGICQESGKSRGCWRVVQLVTSRHTVVDG